MYDCIFLVAISFNSDVWTTEIQSRLGFKNRTVVKFNIPSYGFPIEIASIHHSNKKWLKVTFACIKCTDKEHFKTRPKQSLGYSF